MQAKIYDRPDPRPTPKRDKKPVPSWAQLAENGSTVPSYMYVGVQDSLEENLFYGREPEYRKLRVKNLPEQSSLIGHLDI